MFVDSHIHLTHRLYNGEVPCIDSSKMEDRIKHMNREQILDAFAENDILFCVEPGIEFESNAQILAFSENHSDFIYPAVGVHPTRSPQTKWSKRKELEVLAGHPNVVAIGELGLDYHYKRMQQHRFKQKMWFRWQLKLADKKKLPLVLHIREADHDAIRILRHFKEKLHGGVCHCFTKGPDIANVYTKEFGFMLGIGGSLLQKNSYDLEQTVIKTPLEYLLLETDGPYVKPAKTENVTKKKWQKARNTSLIIPDIAKRVAELKGMDVLEVERVTTENTIRLFGIDVEKIKNV